MSAVVQVSKSREAGWPVRSHLNSVSRHSGGVALAVKASLGRGDDEAALLQGDHGAGGSGLRNLDGLRRLPYREADAAVVVAAVEHGELDVDGARVAIEALPGLGLHHAVGEPDITLRGGALLFHADSLPRA